MRKTVFIGKVFTYFWAKNDGFLPQKSHKTAPLGRKEQALGACA